MAKDTQKTQAANDLRHERLEEAIEDLLFCYPYLIAPDLPRPKRQKWISEKDRVDLFFLMGAEVLIVEIKGKPCSTVAAQQLMRYARILSAEHEVVRGILIGPRLSVAANAILQSSPLSLRFLQLDVDVPSSIFVCRDCRRAYGSRLACCPRCNGTQIIG